MPLGIVFPDRRKKGVRPMVIRAGQLLQTPGLGGLPNHASPRPVNLALGIGCDYVGGGYLPPLEPR